MASLRMAFVQPFNGNSPCFSVFLTASSFLNSILNFDDKKSKETINKVENKQNKTFNLPIHKISFQAMQYRATIF